MFTTSVTVKESSSSPTAEEWTTPWTTRTSSSWRAAGSRFTKSVVLAPARGPGPTREAALAPEAAPEIAPAPGLAPVTASASPRLAAHPSPDPEAVTAPAPGVDLIKRFIFVVNSDC
jgi:hypothetical protein